MRSIGKGALVEAETSGPRATLQFQPDAATRERLEAIVAAESECCSFLTFGLAAEEGRLVLTIQAPEGGVPVMQELVDAFRGSAEVAA